MVQEAGIRQSTLFGSTETEEDAQRDDIDFKMVTFSLGGKDYGVDIMKVKEIAKFESFTFVPNTQPFVMGVYNLRGDIISLIDMRIMFNLPAPQRSDLQPEDGLILRLDSGLIGVVVDRIDRVVGISSESIQPPHPIFADINLKYLSGVVEHEDRLYIILDVERILGETAEEPESVPELPGSAEANSSVPEARDDRPAQTGVGTTTTADMVAPTLHSLSGFTMSDLNRHWVEGRIEEWSAGHGGSTQITTQEEVDEFLAPFASPYTGRFWEEDYLDAVRSLLAADLEGGINVWNPGCGGGYEAYSIACVLRASHPEARIKVWASDNDLLSVSAAPNLTFEKRELPAFYEPFVTEGSRGLGFNADIKQIVLFEFSDITHVNTIPACNIVVIRDILSFLSVREQRRVLAMVEESTTTDTIVISGSNEDLSRMGRFADVSTGLVRAFTVQ